MQYNDLRETGCKHKMQLMMLSSGKLIGSFWNAAIKTLFEFFRYSSHVLTGVHLFWYLGSGIRWNCSTSFIGTIFPIVILNQIFCWISFKITLKLVTSHQNFLLFFLNLWAFFLSLFLNLFFMGIYDNIYSKLATSWPYRLDQGVASA